MSEPDTSQESPFEPKHSIVQLPRPTAWPMMVAAGVTLVMGGFVTSSLLSVGGFIILAIALGGWIKEVRRENTG